MSYIDLHNHSFYSDGTYSPKEILQMAQEEQVSVLAITDHNELKGTEILMELAKNTDIQCVTGVEIDCTEFGRNIHMLGYNFDLENEQFREFVTANRVLLDVANRDFVEMIAKQDTRVSLEDYDNYEYDRRLGGWRAIHYFVERGVAGDLDESFDLFFKGDFSYEDISFFGVKRVIDEIHQAHGKAIIAHPGRVFKDLNDAEFEEILRKLVMLGIDGIKCYYPKHTEKQTEICLKICEIFNLFVTSGSDCHGTFETTKIGQMKTAPSQVKINFDIER
ncbi:PHP domain-containing protein [Anaerorhabdus sp.]|uniref:PHP domain-containing protein n=1 Tax=Anaerorhabdus sp. TaxID=1872524 RepID=UPI002B20FB52|nr:PHP domain-containing protein [Anaerorhabdus sp.]MEA4874438.1 PHP domain-containing protein [Anaerorhabdus sp.]